jgi:hypothetical protein
MEVFGESLTDEEVDKTVIATNKFRPENVLVGQDYIGAVSKEDAIDWLKIIKTAFIFVEKDNNKLQEEMINYYKKKQESNNSYFENYSKEHSNDYLNKQHHDSDKDYYNHSNNQYNRDGDNGYNKYKEHNQDRSDDNRYKRNKSKYDEEDLDYDYDVAEQFKNFWD